MAIHLLSLCIIKITYHFRNTFQYDWRIKARVTKKTKKEWKNAKSTGVLLNLELIDSQGSQIQATFFND